jgi:ankyrin repeat protein
LAAAAGATAAAGAAITALIAAGAWVDAPSGCGGQTALMLACAGKRESMSMVEALLAAGAVVDARSWEGRTALFEACFWCRGDLLRLLLAAGADPRVEDADGTTLLMVTPRDSADNVEFLREVVEAVVVGRQTQRQTQGATSGRWYSGLLRLFGGNK